jgi:magnesium-transporting ATPase (P-type)
MIVGLERWQQEVFTPTVDIAFGLLIIVPALAGVWSWRLYSGGWGGRIVFGFALFLLIISVPLHLRTILTWSTEYLLAFPYWYSAIEVPMFAALSYAVAQLRFTAPMQRQQP